MKRFFISDTHFNDDRLNLYGRDLLFKTKEEVNYNIVNNWNKIVKPTDLVIHLGDIAMNEDGLNLLNKCNGRKILIKGNYDESETSKFDISDLPFSGK
jgi:calcineurin-like phosphoesterase family protein